MADTVIEKLDYSGSAIDIFNAIHDKPYTFFLDSSLVHKRLGRFSFLGCEPFLVFSSKSDRVVLEWAGGRREHFKANPFHILKELFKRYRSDPPRGGGPFTSGGVGWFSYDLKDFIEDLPDIASDDLGLKDCVMGFYDAVFIYDNLKNKAYAAGSGRLDKLKKMIKGRIFDKNRVFNPAPSPLRSNFSKAGYINAIKKAKEYIKKGDIYQVNLSQRFESDLRMEPSLLYSRLRSASPAPFASFLGFGDAAIMSSSPERFLFKEGRYLETRPIKGTRPRGADRKSDLLLQNELKKSVKDNAEHIMIVDLERNDLGRICDYGTVRPTESAVVEKYANVSHLVSTVSGRLRKSADAIDCLLAAFPGGSITGAPKIRAMEIIESLEPVKRSIYTGAIGYISFNGNMDTSIVIRTLIAKGDKVYFSVGGGIVADSDPEEEYQETLDKAKGIMEALGAIPSASPQ
ncbi:MAG: aminodeoxychorismate synthase component I [Candidatus Omnitrophota bacterium]|nr:aminodeoxychorismate synthase component I [Candidatus Omnitrophota bacterium]